MKTLNVTCKGIGDVRADNYDLEVELQEVDLSFLEGIPLREILKWVDSEALIAEKEKMEEEDEQ